MDGWVQIVVGLLALAGGVAGAVALVRNGKATADANRAVSVTAATSQDLETFRKIAADANSRADAAHEQLSEMRDDMSKMWDQLTGQRTVIVALIARETWNSERIADLTAHIEAGHGPPVPEPRRPAPPMPDWPPLPARPAA